MIWCSRIGRRCRRHRLGSGSDHCLSFKSTPEKFAELIEDDGITGAIRGALSLVALERFNAVSDKELKACAYRV